MLKIALFAIGWMVFAVVFSLAAGKFMEVGRGPRNLWRKS